MTRPTTRATVRLAQPEAIGGLASRMVSRLNLRRSWNIALVCSQFAAPGAWAQGSLVGKVVSATPPSSSIPYAQVAIQGGQAIISDSAGAFALFGIRPGALWVVVNAAGFASDSFPVVVTDGDTIIRRFALTQSPTALPTVTVAGTRTTLVSVKLAEFDERRKFGGAGRFLDRSAIALWDDRRTADMLAQVPGLRVKQSRSDRAWAVSGRSVGGGQCAFCKTPPNIAFDPADLAAGATRACYMDVYVDGALVYNSTMPGAPLFDVNSIPPSHIEGLEVYVGPSQVPAKYNRTSGGCGVVLIWTR